jgi:WXG100 family type VII secretion target
MPNNISRADYDQLQQIAQRFGLEAHQATMASGDIRSAMQTLQAGDWIGQGAQAFYSEMNTAVLPSLNRLIAALQSAQRTTLAIRAAFQEAEREATVVLTPRDVVTATPAAPAAQTPTTPAAPATQSTAPMTPVVPTDSGRLPAWLRWVVGDADAGLDLGRSITGMALDVMKGFLYILNSSANTYAMRGIREVWEVVGAVRTTAISRIAGMGWEIQQMVQEEALLLKKMTVIDMAPFKTMPGKHILNAIGDLFTSKYASAGDAFTDLLRGQLGMVNLGANASKLARFAKWLPTIGLGLDFVADGLKYFDKDGGDFYKNPEFWGSIGKDVLYFGGGALLTAGVGALVVATAPVSVPVAVVGLIGAGVTAGAMYLADTVKWGDGQTTTDKIVNAITDNITRPIGNWLSGVQLPSLPSLPSWMPGG